jgi:amino acid transporter
VILSILIVLPIYCLVAFVSLGALTVESGTTWQYLGEFQELGLVEAAKQFMPLGVMLLIFGGLLSTMSALNATTYSSTRVSFAMARDKFLPDS